MGVKTLKIQRNMGVKENPDCWKSRKCWLPAFSLFFNNIFKGLLFPLESSQVGIVLYRVKQSPLCNTAMGQIVIKF